MIRRLRDHVAKRRTTRRREDVNGVVREAVELGLVGTRIKACAGDGIGHGGRVPLLDRIQIGQVIINLVRNAVEAMEASERRET